MGAFACVFFFPKLDPRALAPSVMFRPSPRAVVSMRFWILVIVSKILAASVCEISISVFLVCKSLCLFEISRLVQKTDFFNERIWFAMVSLFFVLNILYQNSTYATNVSFLSFAILLNVFTFLQCFLNIWFNKIIGALVMLTNKEIWKWIHCVYLV